MTETVTREVVFGSKDTETSTKALYLSITDNSQADGRAFRAYLDSVPTHVQGEQPDDWELKVSTLRFKVHQTPEKPESSSESTMVAEEGWIYLFVNGKLWREIKVAKANCYQDVNLNNYLEDPQDHRPATCLPRDCVVVPVSYEGEAYQLEAAYSRVQWSWARIEELGGLDSKDHRAEQADDNELRKQRCTVIDYLGEQQADEEDCFAIMPKENVDYRVIDVNRTDYYVTLPDWEGMGLHYQLQHQSCHAQIDALKNKLTTPHDFQLERSGLDWPAQKLSGIYLALQLNQHYGFPIGEQYFNTRFSSSLSDEQKKTQRENCEKLFKLQDQLDLKKMEKTLRSEEFIAILNTALALRQQLVDLLEMPRFIAMMRDYSTLGSDEKPAGRLRAPYAMCQILEGFNINPLTEAKPFLVDFNTHGELTDQLSNEDPIAALYPRLILADDDVHPLFELCFDWEKLFGDLWADFDKEVKEAEEDSKQNRVNIDKEWHFKGGLEAFYDDWEQTKDLSELDKTQVDELAKSFAKLLAGLLSFDEKALDDIATEQHKQAQQMMQSLQSSGSENKAKDGLDDTVESQKEMIAELKKNVEDLEGEIDLTQSKVDSLDEQIRKSTDKYNALQQEQTDLEAKLANSKLTEAERLSLSDLKVEIKMQEQLISDLRLECDQQMYLQNRQMVQLTQHKTSIRRFEQGKSASQRAQSPDLATVEHQSVHSSRQLKLGNSARIQLQVANMTQYMLGNRVVRLTMSLEDIMNHNYPPGVVPLGRTLYAHHERQKSALLALKDMQSTDMTQAEFGIDFPVNKSIHSTDPLGINFELQFLATEITESGVDKTETVDLYFWRTEATVTVTDEQWQTYQKSEEYKKLLEEYKTNQSTLDSQNKKLSESKVLAARQKKILDELQNHRLASIEAAISLAQSNSELIKEDIKIHGVQWRIQAAVGIFELANMVLQLQKLNQQPSKKQWFYSIQSMLEATSSVSETVEAFLRAASEEKTYNYHNTHHLVRKGMRYGLKVLTGITSIFSCIAGYIDIANALVHGELALWIGGSTAFASALLGFAALFVVGSTLGVWLFVGSLVFGVVSAIASFFYRSDDERLLAKCSFGIDADHNHDPALSHWTDPRAMLHDLLSFLHRPQIAIKKRYDYVEINANLGALASSAAVDWELQIQGDFNFALAENSEDYPWQALYNSTIGAYRHPELMTPDELQVLGQTYGVSYTQLAKWIVVAQQGQQLQIKVPRVLMEQMFEQTKTDDFNFRLIVNAQTQKELKEKMQLCGLSPQLPAAWGQKPNSSDKEQSFSIYGQLLNYQAKSQQWYYATQLQLDLV